MGGFAELALCARGGWYVEFVLTPAFCCGLSSSLRPFPLAGLLLISKFFWKVEPGFSRLAKTPRRQPRGCIHPRAVEVPRRALGTVEHETFLEPRGTRADPCSKHRAMPMPGAHLPLGIWLSSRGRSLDGASSPSWVQCFVFILVFPVALETRQRRVTGGGRTCRFPCTGRLWEHLEHGRVVHSTGYGAGTPKQEVICDS